MDQGFQPAIDYVDGVPVVSADLESPATATLLFAIGMRDETPRTAGVAHLIEHVVMRRVGRVTAMNNAFTDTDTIRFVVAGSDAEIVDFLGRVCEAIAWLPQCTEDDVAPERLTIGKELGEGAEEGFPGPLAFRYGLADLGLVDFGQVTYRTVPVDAVRAFAQTWLHAGNAVVTITGPVPPDLRLPLPGGERRPDRAVTAPVRADLPGWSSSAFAPVALNFELDGTTAEIGLAQACIEAAMLRVLRVERHLVYSAGVVGFGIDHDRVNLTVILDPDPESIPATVDAAVRVLYAIASEGPDSDDHAHAVEALVSSARHLAARAGWLEGVAAAVVRGRTPPVFAEEVAAVAETKPERIGAMISESLGSLIVTVRADGLPDDITQGLALPVIMTERRYVPERVADFIGPSFRDRIVVLSPRFGSGLRGVTLFVSDDALAFLTPDGVYEIPLEDVVLVGRRTNGTLNLILRNGLSYQLTPSQWRDPRGRIARALTRIPAECYYERAD
jgi:hypothetical protein